MKAQMYNFTTWVDETEPIILHQYLKEKLIDAGFNIENVVEKHFEPQGYTALFLLSESHLAIHTFPEEGQAYLELSSCVKMPFDEFIKSI